MLFQKVFIPLQSEYKMRQIIAVCFHFDATIHSTLRKVKTAQSGKKA